MCGELHVLSWLWVPLVGKDGKTREGRQDRMWVVQTRLKVLDFP